MTITSINLCRRHERLIYITTQGGLRCEKRTLFTREVPTGSPFSLLDIKAMRAVTLFGQLLWSLMHTHTFCIWEPSDAMMLTVYFSSRTSYNPSQIIIMESHPARD